MKNSSQTFRKQTVTILGELLPLVGTIGLLGLWFYQQTGVERRSSELRNLATANTVFQTYQSHNAVFNAIFQTAKNDMDASREIRRAQNRNYEFGLKALENVLTSSERAGIPAAPQMFNSGDIGPMLDRTQKRLELLQQRVAEKEKAVQHSVAMANSVYLWLYIGMSLVAIIGAFFKVAGKLSVPLT